MKTILLFTSLVFMTQLQVQAQELDFGAKGGLNLASISIDDYDPVNKTGFHLGLVAELRLTDKFSIQPEVLYSTQGAKIEESGTEFGMTYNLSSTIDLHYVNVPVMAKLYLLEGLSLEAGPQIGFIVKGEQDYEVTFDGQTESGTEDIKDYVKATDFGVAAGLGYKLNSGLFVNARYILGLSNVQNEDRDIGDIIDDEFADEGDLKNRVFQLSIGFMF